MGGGQRGAYTVRLNFLGGSTLIERWDVREKACVGRAVGAPAIEAGVADRGGSRSSISRQAARANGSCWNCCHARPRSIGGRSPATSSRSSFPARRTRFQFISLRTEGSSLWAPAYVPSSSSQSVSKEATSSRAGVAPRRVVGSAIGAGIRAVEGIPRDLLNASANCRIVCSGCGAATIRASRLTDRSAR